MYCALSYCWGKGRNYLTTTQNLAERKKHIGFGDLPQTIKEAILISNAIGIYYLWVDAICIVQNDPQDWAEQAAEMCGIYSGAHLTISATNSNDVEKGFLSKRMQSQVVQLKGVTGTRDIAPVYALEKPKHRYLAEAIPSVETPLFYRAWTFQERFLSSRVLHFYPEELTWECDEERSCECSGILDDFLDSSHEMSGGKWGLLSKPGVIRPFSYTSWNLEVIWEYTNLSLTYETDRLPALLGMANFFKLRGLRNYVAGIWLDDFPLCLAWTARKCSPNPRAITKGIPSWSWASVPGRIAAMDSARGATISFDAKLLSEKRCSLEMSPEERDQQDLSLVIETYSISLGSNQEVKVHLHNLTGSGGVSYIHYQTGSFPLHLHRALPTGLSVGLINLLLLQTRRTESDSYSDHVEEITLVVYPSEDGSGTYYRIGTCQINSMKDEGTIPMFGHDTIYGEFVLV